MVTNSTAELTQLKVDNAVLKVQISELQVLSTKTCNMEAVDRSLSHKLDVMSYKDVRVSNQHQKATNLNASKSSRIITGIIQKPTAANAVAEFPATEFLFIC
jgi:hypothetical protein